MLFFDTFATKFFFTHFSTILTVKFLREITFYFTKRLNAANICIRWDYTIVENSPYKFNEA